MNFRRSKIAQRIVALVFVSVMVSMIAVSSIFVVTQIHGTLAIRKSSIEATGIVFASAVADAVVAGNNSEAYATLRSIARVPGIVYAAAIGEDGQSVSQLGSAVMPRNAEATDSFLEIMRTGFYSAAVDIVKAGRHAGKLVIVADVSDLRSELLRAILLTLVSALAASMFGIALAMRLETRITKPILSLIGAMSHIRAARDYSTKVEHTADDETGILVDTFNGMMAEIDEREAALEKLAYFDPLTELPNRQNFKDRLSKTIESCAASGRAGAVFLLDLDEFRLVNDTLGHSIGDALLIAVAEKLKRECPPGMLLARLGGDEFALIADGVASKAAAIDAIGPISAVLLKPFHIGRHEVSATASIGCALVTGEGSSVEDVLRHADLALYSAKRGGRGRIHFYEDSMAHEAEMRAMLAGDLQKALERGELAAHYQAIVDLETGEVTGFESLLRWTHRERGLVSPGVFISIAESSGQIPELGLWILRESCQQAKEWIDEGHPPREVSVNVSIAQLRTETFCEDVKAILDDTEFPPGLLCLEVTESLYAGGASNRAMKMAGRLKALGVKLALDDFGTGYSSLSYLQRNEFDKIKIDRSFVSGSDSDDEKRMLLEGIVSLGQSLGFEVIAEGAETDGEVELLRAIGVDCLQGFALSRPVPHKEAIAAVRTIPGEFKRRFSEPRNRIVHAAG